MNGGLINALLVIPAQAGIQEGGAAKRLIRNWIPAYAGMTEGHIFYAP